MRRTQRDALPSLISVPLAPLPWGLFHWDASGIYPAAALVRPYASRGRAEAAERRALAADPASDLVARCYARPSA